MKKILITGAGSYIGTSFEKWLSQWPEDYSVETVDMQQENWRDKSFAGFDAVFHVAGIAHVSADPSMEALYYRVNCGLAAETAEKAKEDGVPLFIFMSSIIVYGDAAPIGENRIITAETEPAPANFYGESKLRAERKIHELEDAVFSAAIIRTPMIYGPGSKGNYPKLSRFAHKFPFFPKISNQRSVLFVDNLCQLIRSIIDRRESGTFFPQNRETMCTSDTVKLIAEVNGRRIHLTSLFNPILRLFCKKVDVINKAFGSLVYDRSLSGDIDAYQTCSFEESIRKTEEKGKLR